jgi:hypothetical protein
MTPAAANATAKTIATIHSAMFMTTSFQIK